MKVTTPDEVAYLVHWADRLDGWLTIGRNWDYSDNDEFPYVAIIEDEDGGVIRRAVGERPALAIRNLHRSVKDIEEMEDWL